MRRFVALALLAAFAYSLYSLLSPYTAIPSGWGSLPFSSGAPAFTPPPSSLRTSAPLSEYLKYIVDPLLGLLAWLYYCIAWLLSLLYFFLSGIAAWISYYIAELLSLLVRASSLLVQANRAAPAGTPPTSMTSIGGGGAAHQAATARQAVTIAPTLLAVLLAAVIVVAAAALAFRPRGRKAEAPRSLAVTPAEEGSAFAPSAAQPQRPYSPELPSVSVDLPHPVKQELIKWPLSDDVPPVWPIGVPLVVEAARNGVKLSASCCAEASGNALVVVSDVACNVWIYVEYEGARTALRVKLADLHKEVANSFFDAFKSYPQSMTAREILRSRGAPADIIEIVERAIYSNMPLTYQDFAKYYRWLVHEGHP